MLYLFAGILFSTLMVLIFKWFQVFKVHTFFAILVNYLVALIAGGISFGTFPDPLHIMEKPFFPFAVIIGFCFVTIFSLMAHTAQKAGPTLTSVSARMSLVIPVMFGIIYFGESSPWWKMAGFFLAVPAVIFSSRQSAGGKTNLKYLPLALLLFAGNGFIDTMLSFSQQEKVGENEKSLFIITVFLCATLIGITWFFVSGQFKKNLGNPLKNITGGFILGIINFLSLYCVLSALASNEMESSVFFAFLNIGIIITTALGSMLIFKEKLSGWNFFGIGLATIAIVLVGWETLRNALGI